MGDELYRRALPHWRREGATYFVTWRIARGQSDLSDDERAVVFRAVRHFENARYALDAVVVMNDHVHVVVAPFSPFALADIVHSWKSFTSKWMVRASARSAPAWQPEYFDRIVRDDAELDEKVRYTAHNPWKRWPLLPSYAWVTPQPEMLGVVVRGAMT